MPVNASSKMVDELSVKDRSCSLGTDALPLQLNERSLKILLDTPDLLSETWIPQTVEGARLKENSEGLKTVILNWIPARVHEQDSALNTLGQTVHIFI
jgi:hypothetical protein